jgi:hypothetical protein
MSELHKVKTLDIPIQTSIRILIIDHNFLTLRSMNSLAKIIL